MKTDKVRKVLFSQNPPTDFEKSPYAGLAKKHNVKIDFYKFFQINGLPVANFRKSKISILDYTAIIMTSKNAVDHFFRIANEMNITMPISTNYFCSNAATAQYMQKYVRCRKRRLFFPDNGKPECLVNEIEKHPEDKFLLPLAIDSSINQLVGFLDEREINYKKAEVFKISFADVSKVIDIYSYDMVVFFSPYGIQTLMNSYPDFQQGNIIIGALGSGVVAAAQEVGLEVQIAAPTLEHTSIFSAIDDYLQKKSNRKR